MTVGIAVLQSGATASPTRPTPKPRIFSGTVVDTAGRPVVGATVTLTTSDASFRMIECFLGMFPVPVAPLLIPDLCAPWTTSVPTDRNGRFTVRTREGEPLAKEGLRLVEVQEAASHGMSTGSFSGELRVTRSTRTLPVIPLWTRPAQVTRADGRTRFVFTRPRGASGTLAWSVRSHDGPNPAWRLAVPQGTSTGSLDDRVLENGTRSADATLSGRWAGRTATWTSARLPLSAVGAPVSRGLSCSTYSTDDATLPFSSCPWTDGRLTVEPGLLRLLSLARGEHMCFSDSECASPNTLVLDLGSLQWLKAVVWRGCQGCELELSPDGSTWTTWRGQQQEGRGDAVVTGDLMPARYVRVRGGLLFLVWLRELSVWTSPLTSPPLGAAPTSTAAATAPPVPAAGAGGPVRLRRKAFDAFIAELARANVLELNGR